MYLIGLDVGTTSIGGVLVDGSSGDIVKSVLKDNYSECNTANSWEHCQDSDRIWRTVREVLAELSSGKVEIGGIGLTGQMHGILYVDSQGDAVSPLYTWL
ncbi:FGGY family carbohydrate kinase [Paenibacillus sp. TAB 01]|uniref:FGGY family carbohydrate kinase n=1 Tax=Paenibacillus sp. TAB 01 TaxID=3368988 RepID=UPI003753BF35